MDIRKADSKGRVITPWKDVYVRVDVRDTHMSIDLIPDVVSEPPYPVAQKAQEYLRSFGLDPMLVLRDRANQHGFDYRILDGEGEKVDNYGVALSERRPWPEGFDWDEFVRLSSEAS